MEGFNEDVQEKYTLKKIDVIYQNLKKELLNYSNQKILDNLYEKSFSKYI